MLLTPHGVWLATRRALFALKDRARNSWMITISDKFPVKEKGLMSTMPPVEVEQQTVELKSKTVVHELFLSVQGEGPTQGRRAVFVRFPLCNLRCTCCDTKFTWQREGDSVTKFRELTVQELIDEILAFDCSRVVFTGGEPTLPVSMKVIRTVVRELSARTEEKRRWAFEIETNGTVPLSVPEVRTLYFEYNVVFNVSPKGNVPQDVVWKHQAKDSVPLIDTLCNSNCTLLAPIPFCVKCLVQDQLDFSFMLAIQNRYKIPSEYMWVQPMGTDTEKIIAILQKHFATIMKLGWNISPRLHIFMFGNKRGV